MNENIDKIKEKITRLSTNSDSLVLQRVPLNVAQEFRELAHKEFCGDYGMTLKWLWDVTKGLIGNDNRALYDSIEQLERRIISVEMYLQGLHNNQQQGNDKEEVKKRKRIDGR